MRMQESIAHCVGLEDAALVQTVLDIQVFHDHLSNQPILTLLVFVEPQTKMTRSQPSSLNICSEIPGLFFKEKVIQKYAHLKRLIDSFIP